MVKGAVVSVIIEGQFKDTQQTHFINKEHTDDSLRRTVVTETATIFESRNAARTYLDKMAKTCKRFDECTYAFIENKTTKQGEGYEGN